MAQGRGRASGSLPSPCLQRFLPIMGTFAAEAQRAGQARAGVCPEWAMPAQQPSPVCPSLH